MTFMLNDPLIREDEPIPRDAKLEFRVVLSYDKIDVSEYLDEDETEITMHELVKRMVGISNRAPSGDEQAQWARREQLDYEVIDTSWYAAVDVPGELDRARFEWGWEKERRKTDEAALTEGLDEQAKGRVRAYLDRYRQPWVKEGSRG